MGFEFSKGISGAWMALDRGMVGRVAKFVAGSIGRMGRLGKRGFEAKYGSDRKFRDGGEVSVSVYSAATNTGAFSIVGCDWSSKAGWKGARESAKFGRLPNVCGLTVGIDNSPRESEPKVGAWLATVFESGVINTGAAELFAGNPPRPARSFGGGILLTVEDRWPNEFTVWLENRPSSERLGMGTRADSVFSQGFWAGLV